MQFEYISADTISIVIDDPNDQTCHELVETLRNGDMSVRRALQKYSVSVYMNVFKDLYSQGVLNDHGTGIFILENQSYYNNETGLNTRNAGLFHLKQMAGCHQDSLPLAAFHIVPNTNIFQLTYA